MKVLIWVLFVVLLLGWSGMAWVSAELASWLLQAANSAPADQAAQAIGNWPVPAWAALWISPELIQSLQATWLGAIEWIGAWMPAAESLSGVINVLVWGIWAVGALVLLTIAGVAHWLAGMAARKSRPRLL